MIIKTNAEARAMYKFNTKQRLTPAELKLVERVINRTWNANMPKRIVEEIPCADMVGVKLMAETFGYTHKIGENFYKEISSKDWKTIEGNKAWAEKRGNLWVLTMIRFA